MVGVEVVPTLPKNKTAADLRLGLSGSRDPECEWGLELPAGTDERNPVPERSWNTHFGVAEPVSTAYHVGRSLPPFSNVNNAVPNFPASSRRHFPLGPGLEISAEPVGFSGKLVKISGLWLPI